MSFIFPIVEQKELHKRNTKNIIWKW